MNFPITFYKKTRLPKERKTRKHALGPKIKLGPATLGVITLVIILCMSLLYLMQANSTATKGYEIEKERERITKLESQSEKLKLEIAKLRSTNLSDEVPEKLNLKPLESENAEIVQLETATSVAGISSKKETGSPN